jgi:small subunit ribosomal protein S17
MTQNAAGQPPASEQSGPPSAATDHAEHHGFRRKMIGRVVSAKMQKTVVVEVVTHRRDPLYGKYVRSRSRYKAHAEKNDYKAGDEVEIQEHRPISRGKRFIVTRVVKRFVEE